MIRPKLILIASIALSPLTSTVHGQIINVSDGSGLALAISNATGGETIELAPGNYGSLKINGGGNVFVGGISETAPLPLSSPVTIRSSNPSTLSQIDSIDINGSDNWRISEVAIRPAFPSAIGAAVNVNNSDNFVFSNSLVSYGNSTGWTASDWLNKASGGISVGSGGSALIENNRFENVNHGIDINYNAPNAIVRRNVIDGIRGDGMRGLSDFGIFEQNIAKNFFNVDDNHDDCFQSWAAENGKIGEGTVVGTILRENCCIAYEDPDHPLRGTPQGIGMFDGNFDDWTIENNVIAIDHYHGISIVGVDNSTIANNTVVDLNLDIPGPPWVRLFDHNDGSPSTGNTVINNLTMQPDTIGALPGNTYANNVDISSDDFDNWFVDWENGDFSISEKAPLLGVGAAVKTIPEPSAALLAIFGLCSLLLRRTRKAGGWLPKP